MKGGQLHEPAGACLCPHGRLAEGDPNTGIAIGDDALLVADAQATPPMAADMISASDK